MQPVVRLSLLGILAFAGLTACGDKVQVTNPPVVPIDSSVHSVTVSPPAASVAVNGTTQLAASVDAGVGQKVRTVSWSSSDASTASVDATGKVTGIKGGSVTIIATATADPNVKGASSITVTGGGVPTVTIASINQTTASGSVPADLNNASGQLDITLNVEPNGQIIKTVTAQIKCGTDTASASQIVSNLAPLAAEASAVPITLSINTAALLVPTAAGKPKLHNGACTLSAVVTTGTGTQTATNGTPLTLNNKDVVLVTTTNSGNSAADAAGAFWKSGNITVAATPVLYSGATIASASITLPGAVTPTQTGVTLTAGVASATWAGGTTASATGPNVKGLTLGSTATPVHPTVSFVDSQGNVLTPAQSNPVAQSDVRIDNQAPPAVAGVNVLYTTGTQNTAANWVGKAFTFTKAVALDAVAKADNAGVDVVTFTTQWSPTGAGTWTTFSDVNTIAETSTSTALDLRAVVCDALANCANSAVLTQFGVDLTAPTATTAAGGPGTNQIVGIGQTLTGGGSISVAASDPQGANAAIGSGFGATPVLVAQTQLSPTGATGQVQTCPIGTQSATDGSCTAPAAKALTFTATTTSPGQYALTYNVVDQAGNMSPSVAINYYLDQTAAPAMSGGISIPASITAGSVFTSSGVDDMDFASANGVLHYTNAPGGTGNIVLPAVSSAAGVAFDNTLARASTVTLTLPANQFYRSLAVMTGPGAVSTSVKPDIVGLRGIDAANNLSVPNTATFPATNISQAAGFPAVFTIGVDLNDFAVAVAPATVNNSSTTTTGTRSTTVTATITAINATAASPFTSVCFYLQSPNGTQGGLAGTVTKAATGDLVLLNCTSTFVTTQPTPTTKVISATFSFDPDAGFGTASSLNIFAIGVSANGDAISTGPAALALIP